MVIEKQDIKLIIRPPFSCRKGAFLTFFFKITPLILLTVYCLLPTKIQAQGALEMDSEPVSVRTFDENKRKALADNPDYLYERDKLVQTERDNAGAANRANQNFWDFFVKDQVLGLSVAEILLYTLGIFGLLFFILTFLKVDVRGIFVKNAQQISVNFEDLGENLEALDFEGMIQNARRQGDFRTAVRLVFLETLNRLTAAGYIKWQINKTNQDYLAELRLSRFREEFAALTRSYEYAWYGDYPVNEQTFDIIEQTFRSFQQKVVAGA